MKKIRKIVIPAAGLGTRFLPATKAQPKEMLPIVDKPTIQYIVEDAVAAGIEDIIIVTGWHKRTIEDHFDTPFELEYRLSQSGKKDQLEEVRKIGEMANFIFVRQREPLGNGHAVLMARNVVGDEPFAVAFGDDIFIPRNEGEPNRMQQLVDTYNRYGRSVLTVVEVGDEDTWNYGIIQPKEIEPDIYQVNSLVEKPGPQHAPSRLAAISGYVLTPEIFEVLEKLPPGKNGEIWLADAIQELTKLQTVYACQVKAKYYDVGSKIGYLIANIDFALRRSEFNEPLRAYMRKLIEDSDSANGHTPPTDHKAAKPQRSPKQKVEET